MFLLKLDELDMILRSMSINTIDSELILRQKILNILNGPRSTLTQKLEIKILTTHLSKQRILYQPNPGRVLKIKNLLSKYQHNTIVSIETMGFTHDLPFFKTIHSLSNPIHCHGNNFSSIDLNRLYDEIKNIQNYIHNSWDPERK